MIPGGFITNLTAASRSGTTVTAGTAHTEDGSWAEIITAAANTGQSDGFWIDVHSVSTAATDTGMLMDVAYADDAAGTNRVEIVTDYDVGEAVDFGGGGAARLGKVEFFPQRIPTGKSVQCRVRATIASDTCVVAMMLQQSVQHINDVGATTTYGAVTASSRGTSVTPGSGAFGSWTTIGTTSATHNLFSLGYDSLSDTTIAAAEVLIEFGYGATPTVIGMKFFRQSASEDIVSGFPATWFYASVGASVDLKARIASAETEARGVIIYAATGTVVSAGSAGPQGQLIGTGPLVSRQGV